MSPSIDADSPIDESVRDDDPGSSMSGFTVRGAIGRILSGPSGSTPGPDVDPIERHRAEHREPSIWLWRRIVGTAFAFILVTLAWYLIKVPDGLISDETLPTQTQVASAFNEFRAAGPGGAKLVEHVAASLARLVIAGLIGVVIGAPLGFAIGSAPLGRTVADPIMSLLGMVPAVAMAPLAIIWFGAGEGGIIAAVAAVMLWVAAEVTSTVRVRSLRGIRADVPHEVSVGLRRVLGAGWAGVLAVETLLAPVGLGPMVWSAQQQVDAIVAAIYVIGLVGLTVDGVPRVIEYLVVNGAPADRAATRARHPAARTRAVRTGPVAGAR